MKSMFQESDGKTSFARVATFVLVLCSMGWVTHLVWHNHALPDFGGLALFISAIYGINKVSDVVGNRTPPPSPPAS